MLASQNVYMLTVYLICNLTNLRAHKNCEVNVVANTNPFRIAQAICMSSTEIAENNSDCETDMAVIFQQLIGTFVRLRNTPYEK